MNAPCIIVNMSGPFGTAAMQLNANPLPQGRKLKLLHDACTANVNAHQARARGILALAQEFAGKESGQ